MTVTTLTISGQLPRSTIVIGTGVVGMATAWSLARRGVAVTLVDAAMGPGEGASFANGGQLSYGYTDALASPALLRKIPALLLGRDAGLSFSPHFDPDELRWLLRFLRNATYARFLANTSAGLALGVESRLAMHALLQQHPIDFGHRIAGKLLVYQDQAGFAAAGRLAELKQSHGAQTDILTPDRARELEPALATRRDPMVGAIHSPQDELGDPHQFCCGLLAILTAQYGVVARFGTRVSSWDEAGGAAAVVTTMGERLVADTLVVCAGTASGRILKRLGLGSALLPMKGYSFTAPKGKAPLSMSVTDVARKIVFCPLGNTVRVAGLAELGRRDTGIEPRQIDYLRSLAVQSLPDSADYTATGRHWAGLRPMTANSQPIIARVSPRVAINAGHGMLGWTFAMGAAERLAEIMGREWA